MQKDYRPAGKTHGFSHLWLRLHVRRYLNLTPQKKKLHSARGGSNFMFFGAWRGEASSEDGSSAEKHKLNFSLRPLPLCGENISLLPSHSN